MIESTSQSDHGAGAPTLRLFIALPLPEELVGALAELSARLQKGFRFTPCRPSWVNPEAMHLTLAFLGQRPAELVESLRPVLAELAAATPAPRLRAHGLGVFPDWRRPRVLWTGLEDLDRRLAPLHAGLTQRLEPFGFAPDHKTFQPHLTLARFNALSGVAVARPIVQSHNAFVTPDYTLGDLVLFQSRLDSAGAIHSALIREPFSTV